MEISFTAMMFAAIKQAKKIPIKVRRYGLVVIAESEFFIQVPTPSCLRKLKAYYLLQAS